jgi:vancomycin resistance protein YoaR
MAKNRKLPKRLTLPTKGNLSYENKSNSHTSHKIKTTIHHPKNGLPRLTFPDIKAKQWVLAIGFVCVAAIIFLGWVIAYAANYHDKIYPNTFVGTINLSGKTIKEAQTELEDAKKKLPNEITIQLNDQKVAHIPVSDISLTYNTQDTAKNSFTAPRTGSKIRQAYHLIVSRFQKTVYPAVYTIDGAKTDALMSSLVEKQGNRAQNAQIILQDDNTISVTPAKEGSGITLDQLKKELHQQLAVLNFTVALKPGIIKPTITEAETKEAVEQTKTIIAKTPVTFAANDTKVTADAKKVFSWIRFSSPTPEKKTGLKLLHKAKAQKQAQLTAELDSEQVKNFIANIAVNVDREVKNAEIRMVDGQLTVVQDHSDGQKLQLNESVNETLKQLTSPDLTPNLTITLPMQIVEAPIKATTINSLGIKELIGRAETNFKGSPTNRAHNITIGASFLNGELIAPGQEFSTVKTLGKIDDSTGYLPELVIKENRTIPEYGGGLCQVSSTLFRSVLNAGLKVTERQNHSYRVSYYEPPVGLDATIYLPKPDFRFLNDTPGHILIQNKIEGTKIVFELYGTKDGRAPTISDSVVSDITEPPPPSYTETDTLPKGETKQIEKAHQGATAVVTYTVNRDGKEINKQVFRSKYKPWQARFLVGTKEAAPPPSPAP